jgi:hypothetical protein
MYRRQDAVERQSSRYLVVDNTFDWNFDALAGGVGLSAHPPAQSSLSIQYTLTYSSAELVDTTLVGACGVVTLNTNPNPPFYKNLSVGLYDIAFGVDSCAGDVVSPAVSNVSSSACPFLAYVLDPDAFHVSRGAMRCTPQCDVARAVTAVAQLCQRDVRHRATATG